jgi:hypothetical protein
MDSTIATRPWLTSKYKQSGLQKLHFPRMCGRNTVCDSAAIETGALDFVEVAKHIAQTVVYTILPRLASSLA